MTRTVADAALIAFEQTRPVQRPWPLPPQRPA
jgi:hypothetical protein